MIVISWNRLCPHCGKNNQKGKDLDNSFKWLMTYECPECKTQYKVNFGEKQFDEITIINKII